MYNTSELNLILEHVRNRFYGKYRGEVVSNMDASNRGRIQVKVPSVLGDEAVWAEPCVPYAGDQVGFYSLPDEGAGVWVEFEGGKPSFPIWVGCFWRTGELPPEAPQPTTRIWRTPKLILKVDDSAGESLLQTGDNQSIEMKSSGDIVTTSQSSMKTTVGPAGIKIETGGTGKVEVTSASTKINNGGIEVT